MLLQLVHRRRDVGAGLQRAASGRYRRREAVAALMSKVRRARWSRPRRRPGDCRSRCQRKSRIVGSSAARFSGLQQDRPGGSAPPACNRARWSSRIESRSCTCVSLVLAAIGDRPAMRRSSGRGRGCLRRHAAWIEAPANDRTQFLDVGGDRRRSRTPSLDQTVLDAHPLEVDVGTGHGPRSAVGRRSARRATRRRRALDSIAESIMRRNERVGDDLENAADLLRRELGGMQRDHRDRSRSAARPALLAACPCDLGAKRKSSVSLGGDQVDAAEHLVELARREDANVAHAAAEHLATPGRAGIVRTDGGQGRYAPSPTGSVDRDRPRPQQVNEVAVRDDSSPPSPLY